MKYYSIDKIEKMTIEEKYELFREMKKEYQRISQPPPECEELLSKIRVIKSLRCLDN